MSRVAHEHGRSFVFRRPANAVRVSAYQHPAGGSLVCQTLCWNPIRATSQESALRMCQLVEKLLRQKAPGQLAAQLAYAVPAFLTVTAGHSRSLGNSWQEHMQIAWQLFRDSPYNKGILACTEADRLREQADIAVAHIVHLPRRPAQLMLSTYSW